MWSPAQGPAILDWSKVIFLKTASLNKLKLLMGWGPVSVNISEIKAREQNHPLQAIPPLSSLSCQNLLLCLFFKLKHTRLKTIQSLVSPRNKVFQGLIMTLFVKYLLYSKHCAQHLIIFIQSSKQPCKWVLSLLSISRWGNQRSESQQSVSGRAEMQTQVVNLGIKKPTPVTPI